MNRPTRPLAAACRTAALALALGALGAGPALAQQGGEKLEQAKALYNMGAQLYSAQKYVAAIQNFEEAYRLAPRPALLFSIAQAERRYYFESRQPDYLRRAVAHYKQYLAQAEQGGRRAEAGQALAELELVASKIEPVSPAGATSVVSLAPAPPKPTLSVMATQVKGARIWVDGKQADEGLFSDEVNPGKHSIKVSADGYYDEEREVTMQNAPLAFDISLRERPATLTFATLAGAQISVDGRFVGVAPLPLPIEVSPGVHVVSISRNGHEGFSSEVELERGESRAIQAKPHRTTQRAVSYGLLGVSGVSLVAGGVFSLLALRSQSDANAVLSARDTRSITQDELDKYNKARDRRDNLWRPAAIGSFGAAVGLGLVGGLLYAFDQPTARASEPRERSKPKGITPSPTGPSVEISAAPSFGPGWWGLAAGGKF